MSNYGYLKPKASFGGKEMKRKRGMFVNPPPYPQMGGFSSANKKPGHDELMTLEKSPSSRGQRPL